MAGSGGGKVKMPQGLKKRPKVEPKIVKTKVKPKSTAKKRKKVKGKPA